LPRVPASQPGELVELDGLSRGIGEPRGHGRDRQRSCERSVATFDGFLAFVADEDLAAVGVGGVEVGEQGVPAVGRGLGIQRRLVVVPGQGGCAGGGVGTDLGA
jgi:hypothetical protein